MMRLADVVEAFRSDLEAYHGACLLPGHRKALAAILRCRPEMSGRADVHCPTCDTRDSFPLSCGHRACPCCQFATARQWLERQRAKRLPCDYFLVTFTLPVQLRPLAFSHQRIAYDLLLELAWQTLAEFGTRDRKLSGRLGATAVLHTHSRALDFHPHVHVVVPAGAVDLTHRLWRSKRGKFLFHQASLAEVFRAKWFQAMADRGWRIRTTIPDEWVVDCKRVGNGDKALTYLGRYLYRGVLREEDIVGIHGDAVTFRYVDNNGSTKTRTLEGAAFLWLLLQHVLPKGFRRARDYGFLHANAKKTIRIIQWLFRVAAPGPSPRPPLRCRQCGGLVKITVFPRKRIRKPPPLPPGTTDTSATSPLLHVRHARHPQQDTFPLYRLRTIPPGSFNHWIRSRLRAIYPYSLGRLVLHYHSES